MRAALCDAQFTPEDVDYVNAHGTGTAINDVTEARAIREVFGSRTDRLAVSSTKSMHGHALGASGALDCVPHEARQMQVQAALSNSFAFGGLNAVLAVRSVDENPAR